MASSSVFLRSCLMRSPIKYTEIEDHFFRGLKNSSVTVLSNLNLLYGKLWFVKTQTRA